MIKNRTTQLIFQTIYCTLGLVGCVACLGIFDNIKNIRWDFYVHFTNISNFLCLGVMVVGLVQTIKKKEDGNKHCTFKSVNNTIVYYQNCYVINELRNLAIETIQTSHFIIVDGDGLISCNYFDKMLPLATMEDNLKSYIPLLSNEKEILLFPLFQFSSEYHKVCRYKGQCKEAYFIFSM